MRRKVVQTFPPTIHRCFFFVFIFSVCTIRVQQSSLNCILLGNCRLTVLMHVSFIQSQDLFTIVLPSGRKIRGTQGILENGTNRRVILDSIGSFILFRSLERTIVLIIEGFDSLFCRKTNNDFHHFLMMVILCSDRLANAGSFNIELLSFRHDAFQPCMRTTACGSTHDSSRFIVHGNAVIRIQETPE